MRALLVHPGPSFSVADVYNGWCKGLAANDVQVATLNLDARLNLYTAAQIEREDGTLVHAFDTEGAFRRASAGILEDCFRLLPDIVVIVSGFFVPPEIYAIVRARGIRVVLLHTESPYEDNVQMLRAQHADLNVLNDPTNLADFNEFADTIYIPHGYDPAVHKPGPAVPEYKSDFGFVGTGFESRVQFFNACDFDGVDAIFAGNWTQAAGTPLADRVVHPLDECFDNTDAVKLYNSTKVSANLYRKEAHRDATAEGWAMGPREVELAACGTFFLRESRPEGDELFPMLPTFDGPDDFTDKLRWWLGHDTARQQAAQAARAAVIDRTFERHAQILLRHLAA